MPDLATRVRGSVTWSNDRRRQDGACWVSTKRGHSRRPERKGKERVVMRRVYGMERLKCSLAEIVVVVIVQIAFRVGIVRSKRVYALRFGGGR